ncbi:MAG: hypothetical protein LC104_09580 [Bacteroidales bacterium]|nr:hypothetical protein [Bacteroidales bacterium]
MHSFRYDFAAQVPTDEIAATLILAVLATECLHGSTSVRRETAYAFDPQTRECTIDTTSRAGADLNRLFAGFAAREFGPGGFLVLRVPA